MLGYLFLDIICSSNLTPFSEPMMSAGKYPSIFSRQMEAIVYIDNDRAPLILFLILILDLKIHKL